MAAGVLVEAPVAVDKAVPVAVIVDTALKDPVAEGVLVEVGQMLAENDRAAEGVGEAQGQGVGERVEEVELEEATDGVGLVEAVFVFPSPPLLFWLPRMLIATELFVYQFEPWL